MQHAPGFLRLVEEARPRVREITLEELRRRMDANPDLVLLDVREESEWAAGRVAGARHLGKGVLERDLEARHPDPDTEIAMYCGGGYRSVLTCDAAAKMGYRNVLSVIGGYKALVAAGWPIER